MAINSKYDAPDYSSAPIMGGLNGTGEEPSELEMRQTELSEFHKSVRGRRWPDGFSEREWNSLDWVNEQISELHREVELLKLSPEWRAVLRRNGWWSVEEPAWRKERNAFVIAWVAIGSRFGEIIEEMGCPVHVRSMEGGDLKLVMHTTREKFEWFLGCVEKLSDETIAEALGECHEGGGWIDEGLTGASRTRLDELQQSFSDYYKAVWGCRPQVSDSEFQSLGWMERAWSELDAEMEKRKSTPEGRAFLRSEGWQIDEE